MPNCNVDLHRKDSGVESEKSYINLHGVYLLPDCPHDHNQIKLTQ